MGIDVFLQVANLLRDPLLLVSGDGIVLAVNHSAKGRLGLDSHAVRGQPLAHFVTNSTEQLADFLGACSRSGDRVRGALVVKAPDGQEEPCQADGAVLRPRSEKAPALLILCLLPRAAVTNHFVLLTQRVEELSREIHRRKRTEEQLRDQREWLQVTLGSIGDAVIATDTDGRITFVNPVARTLTGWSEEEAIGQPIETVFSLLHEKTRQRRENPVITVLREGSLLNPAHHTILVDRNGVERFISDCAAPIRSEGGQVLGVVLVFHDVTERRRADETLRVGEERLRLAVEATELGTWDYDPTTGSLEWSTRCKAVFGLPPDAAVNHDVFLNLLHVEDRMRIQETVQRALDPANSGEFDTEYRCLWPDREVRWVRSRGRAFFEGEGPECRAVRFIGTVLDVTGQKLTQQALLDADRRKEELLAMLAHELRNPLATVLNSLHLLRIDGSNDQVRIRAQDMIERQIRHLAQLTDGLLEATRLLRGQVPLNPLRLDLGRLIRTQAEDRRRSLEQVGLMLTVTIPTTPVWIMGDRTRLAQVLDNLLDNATKFTDRGGLVSVSVESDVRGNSAVVRVQDTGIGIEPELLDSVWEVFVQADRTLDRRRGGLGLGLSVVKGLVELHGGEVHLASAGPGQGAEFVVRLPLEEEPAALSPQPLAKQIARKRLHVVVIEDNRDSADSLRLLLELAGHEVRVARTGPEGLQIAEEWHPDVVLSDIGLPGMDGFEVGRRLRQHPSLKNMLLVALTGYGDDASRRQSHESGFDHHLVKPTDPAAIFELLASRASKENEPSEME